MSKNIIYCMAYAYSVLTNIFFRSKYKCLVVFIKQKKGHSDHSHRFYSVSEFSIGLIGCRIQNFEIGEVKKHR